MIDGEEVFIKFKLNVHFLKTNSGKKGQGMPVVRNPQFYFREGFCWIDVNSTYLKARLKGKGVFDVLSMSLFTQVSLPDWYYVCLINSDIISNYVAAFINNTSHFQINDARQLPIIIPSEKQLIRLHNLFNKAQSIKQQQFNSSITYFEAEIGLHNIQKELDAVVSELYSI